MDPEGMVKGCITKVLTTSAITTATIIASIYSITFLLIISLYPHSKGDIIPHLGGQVNHKMTALEIKKKVIFKRAFQSTSTLKRLCNESVFHLGQACGVAALRFTTPGHFAGNGLSRLKCPNREPCCRKFLASGNKGRAV